MTVRVCFEATQATPGGSFEGVLGSLKCGRVAKILCVKSGDFLRFGGIKSCSCLAGSIHVIIVQTIYR